MSKTHYKNHRNNKSSSGFGKRFKNRDFDIQDMDAYPEGPCKPRSEKRRSNPRNRWDAEEDDFIH